MTTVNKEHTQQKQIRNGLERLRGMLTTALDDASVMSIVSAGTFAHPFLTYRATLAEGAVSAALHYIEELKRQVVDWPGADGASLG